MRAPEYASNLKTLLFEISCGLNEMQVRVLRPHIRREGSLHDLREILHTFSVLLFAQIVHVRVDRARKNKLLILSGHV
jgi:hypothetical protein